MRVRQRIRKQINNVDLLFFEEKYCTQFETIAGVDEVGRGSLIGPIYAAAVVLPNLVNYDKNQLKKDLYGIFDSKQLSEKERNYYYNIIIKIAVDYFISRVPVEKVNELNPHHASHLAMTNAIKGLKKVDFVLVDGSFKLEFLNIPQEAIIDGDSKSLSIAAASILAKVSRDKEIKILSKKYPQYNWANNKGYYCRKHLQAINKYGITDQHRNFPIVQKAFDGYRKNKEVN